MKLTHSHISLHEEKEPTLARISVLCDVRNPLQGQEPATIPGSTRTLRSGCPVLDHLSTQKSCDPVLEIGPKADITEEKNEGYFKRPACGVANVLKLTGVTSSKKLRWWRIL